MRNKLAVLAIIFLPFFTHAQPSPGEKVSLQAATSGGTEVWKSLSITGTVAAVKDSEGQVYGIYAWNNTNCRRYLKIFGGKASEITLGTSISAIPILLLPNQPPTFIPIGVGTQFPTGISAACTKYPEDTNTAGANANECVGALFYK